MQSQNICNLLKRLSIITSNVCPFHQHWGEGESTPLNFSQFLSLVDTLTEITLFPLPLYPWMKKALKDGCITQSGGQGKNRRTHSLVKSEMHLSLFSQNIEIFHLLWFYMFICLLFRAQTTGLQETSLCFHVLECGVAHFRTNIIKSVSKCILFIVGNTERTCDIW